MLLLFNHSCEMTAAHEGQNIRMKKTFYFYFLNNHVSYLQVPIKNIERELICPICKELFTHPLILPCQHSICHKCVKELLMMNHEDSFDAGSECSLPGSPRSRVPSPSMEKLDRLVRSGGCLEKMVKNKLNFPKDGICVFCAGRNLLKVDYHISLKLKHVCLDISISCLGQHLWVLIIRPCRNSTI